MARGVGYRASFLLNPDMLYWFAIGWVAAALLAIAIFRQESGRVLGELGSRDIRDCVKCYRLGGGDPGRIDEVIRTLKEYQGLAVIFGEPS